MRYNPFMPNGIISHGMFHGRVAEIDAIEKCLHQAKHGNPTHFPIQGERGIGKSSLFFIIQAQAEGKVQLSDDSRLNFLVVSIDHEVGLCPAGGTDVGACAVGGD